MTRRPCQPTRNGGWFLTEFVVSLSIVAALSLMAASVVAQYRKAMRSLEQQQAAIRDAQAVADSLSRGQEPAQTDPPLQYQIDPLELDAGPGYRWVQLTLTRQERTARLSVLVPQPTAEVK